MGKLINNNSYGGFTIIELTIATTVFSIILLLSLVGFTQIGKLFYKGVSITHTSDAAKQVLTSVKGDVSFDVSTTSYTQTNGSFREDNLDSPSVKRYYFCAGANRYTFRLGEAVDSEKSADELKQTNTSGWRNFGILKDRVVNGCPKPFNSAGGNTETIDSNNVTELLGDKMRLSDISIGPTTADPNNKLYTIHIKIAYGDNSVFKASTASSTNPICVADNSTASSFCFVSDLRTIVRKGL